MGIIRSMTYDHMLGPIYVQKHIILHMRLSTYIIYLLTKCECVGGLRECGECVSKCGEV